jgi:hypothetical protein
VYVLAISHVCCTAVLVLLLLLLAGGGAAAEAAAQLRACVHSARREREILQR